MSYRKIITFDKSSNLWKHEIEGIKDKTRKLLYDLSSAKISSNANILMCQIWAKKYMKTDLMKVIFTN